MLMKRPTSTDEGIVVGGDAVVQQNGTSSTETGTDPVATISPSIYFEQAITSELNLVMQDAPDGTYVLPKASNPFEWLGVIFLRRGPYQGGIFRFTIHLPEGFPDSTDVPEVVFDISVFNPLISPQTRILSTAKHFPEGWKPRVHHICHLLLVIQRLFYRWDNAEYVNDEAKRLYESDKDLFRRKITDSVRQSREIVYDNPPSADQHSVRFTPWDASVHEAVRRRIISAANQQQPQMDQSATELAPSGGLSWFDPDLLTILGPKS